MIPKVIHYCWFGSTPKGEKERKCIESWKKFCPDYSIKEWNESNTDMDMIPFVKSAFEQKKYAFASDVIRLQILYDYGGIYFDTDVEAVKNFDDLLNCRGFIGFENNDYVNTGQCVAAEKGNPFIKEMLDYYKALDSDDETKDFIGCPIVNTEILKNHGLRLNGEKQCIEGFNIYPKDYFNPYDDPTGRLNVTDNTYSIHWYSKSWMSKKEVLRSKLTKPLHRIFGKNFFH